MARNTPTIRGGMLHKHSDVEGDQILLSINSPEWFSWLEVANSFAFENASNRFTARKEQRSSGWYWYAYSRIGGQLHSAYLGKSAELSLERLSTIAQILTYEGHLHAVAPGGLQQVPRARKPTKRFPLLMTKLSIPHARSSIIVHTDALKRLQQVAEYPLTLVSAPAGFGKTTLLAHWVAASSLSVAWVVLDEGDNDQMRLWTYVLAALDQVVPDIFQTVLPWVHVSPSQQIPEVALTTLINALAAAPDPTILVLDNYHVLKDENGAIHQALTFLLEHLPPQVHLVLTGRIDPPLPLARLRAHNQLIELHTDDLRFSEEETALFLTQSTGLSLSEHEVAALHVATEGWVTGLQLAALSMQSRADTASVIASFGGGNRYILDFLTDEVFLHLNPEIQAFLLDTSILERLSAPLCDAVVASDNSQQMLEALERLHLFLVPLDERREWFRYHHLFAEVLRHRLQKSDASRLPDLYLRACTWCEQHGHIEEAISYAFAAGDYDRTARIIESLAESVSLTSELAMLRRWLDTLPDAVVRARPHLCVIHAYALLTNSEFAAFAQRLRDAEENSSAVSRELRSAEHAILYGEIIALQATLAFLRGDLRQCSALCHQALDLLPQGHVFREHVMLNLGAAFWMNGDLREASQVLAEVRQMSEMQQNLYFWCASTTTLARVRLLQGQLGETMNLCAQAARRLAEHGVVMEFSGVYVSMGTVLYLRNDLDAAALYLERGIESSRLEHNTVTLINGCIMLAFVRLAQGNATDALQMIEEAIAHQRETFAWDVAWMRAHQAIIWACVGHLDAAMSWAREWGQRVGGQHMDEAQAQNPTHVREFERIALAQVYLAQGMVREASASLAQSLASAEADGRLAHVLEILVLQAGAYDAQGDVDAAAQTVQRALALAEPEGAIQPFVRGGPRIRNLLRLLQTPSMTGRNIGASDEAVTSYCDVVLAAFGQDDGAVDDTDLALISDKSAYQALDLPLFTAPLSERELEVLQLLASGASNQAIAHELVIAMGTVKRHVSNIFVKLGAQSRTQAIARAHQLHLIEPSFAAQVWRSHVSSHATDAGVWRYRRKSI